MTHRQRIKAERIGRRGMNERQYQTLIHLRRQAKEAREPAPKSADLLAHIKAWLRSKTWLREKGQWIQGKWIRGKRIRVA